MGTITVHRKAVLLLAIFCFVAFNTDAGPAQRRGAYPESRSRRELPTRRSRMLREGDSRYTRESDQGTRGAATDITSKLQAVLRQVNSGGELRPDEINLAMQSLREARRSLSSFSDQEKCEYYLLNAWTDYYASQYKRAMLNAAKASKADSANSDAKTSHIALALVNEDFRVVSSLSKEQPKDTIFRDAASGYSASRYSSSGGMLNFDPASLQFKLLGRKVSRMQLNCLNGSTFLYDPQKMTLCMLFWKVTSGSSDSDLSRSPSGSRYSRDMSPRGAIRASRMSRMGSFGSDSSQQMQAFSDLFNASFTNPNVRFVAVNLDSFNSRLQVMTTLFSNSWPWAQVMASDPANAAIARFGQSAITQPSLAIAGPGGTISYAGPATGFLPSLLLRRHGYGSGPVEQPAVPRQEQVLDVNKPQAGAPLPGASGLAPGNLVRSVFGITGDMSGSQSTGRLPAGPYGSERRKPTNLESTPTAGVQTEEEQLNPQVENWYQMAVAFKKKAGVLPTVKYNNIVRYCRLILENNPESPRAEEARQFLREIPEKYRKRYNVTDEEMGL